MSKTLIAVAMALGSITAAHADSTMQWGEGSYPSDSMQSQPSTLTRAAVIADLKAARANGTLPMNSETYGMPTAADTMASTLTRAEVRQQAIEATQASFHAHLSSNPD